MSIVSNLELLKPINQPLMPANVSLCARAKESAAISLIVAAYETRQGESFISKNVYEEKRLFL
jgi:hypothetical protein